MIHIILCGGCGTRLWPLSRECKPKQFLSLLDQKSLLQSTVLGHQALVDECIVVCHQDHYHLALGQLLEYHIMPSKYILESVSRNTAAAVCLSLQGLHPDAIVLITPSDHYIDYSENYFKDVLQAKQFAKQDEIVIFGIPPTRPETGFGYIEASQEGYVHKFHEKPDLGTAKEYIKKDFVWNSGMICAKANVLLNALKTHVNNVLKDSEFAIQNAKISKEVESMVYRITEECMIQMPSISIDHALLEKLNSLRCIRGHFQWSDIGAFDAIYNHLLKDHEGNSVNAKNIVSIDSKNNFIIGNHRMISTIDIEDLVIIDTPDALLVSKAGSTQKVREVVSQLKDLTTQLHKTHLEEQRPWGSFTVLDSLERSKVKRIVVKPGKRLSLQKHRYRNEHWVIVEGTALMTLGKEMLTLTPNQSVYIEQGEIHRVENIGSNDLVIIEVQYGSYTGEDDIIRIEDDFFRALSTTTTS
ncbi:MAG: mannose-1-phosphate guanylyltransferase/mannose-6-phosphate isomerase [Parachlamydiaceae bacterium]|nr:mannose-1-phosphate guanylyltransferase/mannose-6-phosphate isomerase [Parachlamydiaceae bacterium]